MTATFNQIGELLDRAPVIPVLTITDLAAAVPLARALVRGGLTVLEVTLRSEAALAAIAAIQREVAGAAVGAGTVLEPRQMEAVARAGGRFCVSPGATPALLRAAAETGMLLLPGAATATEIMILLEQDVTFMKFFPAAAAGGIAALKSFLAPLPQAVFCPTGGIDAASAPAYLALTNVRCVGGTWVCPQEALAVSDWPRIEALARQAASMPRGRAGR